MAEVEQLNDKGIGIGHSWQVGMLPDTKRWLLLLQMQRNHSDGLTWWWVLLYRTHPPPPKIPVCNRNFNSKLFPSICVLHRTCTYPSEPVRKWLIARENPVPGCYFPPFGVRAIAPRSAVNQCLIYHPPLNVSCCLGLLSRVGSCFLAGLLNKPVWSVKGTGILQGEGHLLSLKLLLGSINFER